MSKQNILRIINAFTPMMNERGFILDEHDHEICNFVNKPLNHSHIMIKNHIPGYFGYQAAMSRAFDHFVENKEERHKVLLQLFDLHSDNQVDQFVDIFSNYFINYLYPSFEQAYNNPSTIFPTAESERRFFENSSEYKNTFKQNNENDALSTALEQTLLSLRNVELCSASEMLLAASGGMVLYFENTYDIVIKWNDDMDACFVDLMKDGFLIDTLRPVVIAYSLWQKENDELQIQGLKKVLGTGH